MPPTELWTAKSFLKEFCSQNSVRTDKPSSHSSSGFQHQMALMLCRTQKELLGSCSTFSGMFPSIPVRASTYSEFCCQLIQRQGMFSISYTQLSLFSCMYTHITGKEQGITRVQAQTLSFSLEINKEDSLWCKRKQGFVLVYPLLHLTGAETRSKKYQELERAFILKIIQGMAFSILGLKLMNC